MAIEPICACCRKPLEEPGAIVFGPPAEEKAPKATVAKYHLCRECFEEIRAGHLEAE
jgi:hypothetical protein